MPIYFDNNATTQLDPRVVEAMLPYLSGPYGNPSSLHRYGRASRDAVEQARAQVARLVNAQPGEILWTSGGTEANNLAIKGVAEHATPTRILYGVTEHPAVMEAAVIPSPDPIRLAVPKCLVSVADGHVPGAELAADILAHAREMLGPHKRIRRIQFEQDLPKTISGKIRRVELRKEEAGRAAGAAPAQGQGVEYREEEFPA